MNKLANLLLQFHEPDVTKLTRFIARVVFMKSHGFHVSRFSGLFIFQIIAAIADYFRYYYSTISYSTKLVKKNQKNHLFSFHYIYKRFNIVDTRDSGDLQGFFYSFMFYYKTFPLKIFLHKYFYRKSIRSNFIKILFYYHVSYVTIARGMNEKILRKCFESFCCGSMSTWAFITTIRCRWLKNSWYSQVEDKKRIPRIWAHEKKNIYTHTKLFNKFLFFGLISLESSWNWFVIPSCFDIKIYLILLQWSATRQQYLVKYYDLVTVDNIKREYGTTLVVVRKPQRTFR